MYVFGHISIKTWFIMTREQNEQRGNLAFGASKIKRLRLLGWARAGCDPPPPPPRSANE